MPKNLNVYKPLGLTTFGLIQKLRQVKPEYAQANIGFAGRLDPMAEGVVLLLLGDENKNRLEYLHLDKEYEFEILFGFETDTYDTLGIIKNTLPLTAGWQEKLPAIVRSYRGKITQKFPPYSSKHIGGKALFQWAHEGRLSEIEIPEVEREIYSIELLSVSEIEKEALRQRIIGNINKVEGLFRQEQIIGQWQNYFDKTELEKLPVAKIKISASSGTYMRSLAHEIGARLSSNGVALSIKRTKVGQFTESDSLKI